MRLTCPNCQAQYEVDDSVIPDGGRDVQCSNCGHTWFQTGKASAAAPAPQATPAPQETPRDEDAIAAAVAASLRPQDPAPQAQAPADDGAGDSDMAEADEAGADLSPAPAPGATPRRALDSNLLAILREEAAREAEARRAEGSALEMQPDLGLEDAPVHAAAPADRDPAGDAIVRAVAQRRGQRGDAPASEGDRVAQLMSAAETPEDEVGEDPAPVAPRRELLPDVEEISSSLRATSDRVGEPAAIDAPQMIARQRSGFRLGFFTAVLIAVAALWVYAFAPRIGGAVPALAPALDGYVTQVDRGRIWLDQRLRDMTEALQAQTGG